MKDELVRGPRRDGPRARRPHPAALFPVILAALIIIMALAGQSLLFSAVARADGRPPGGNLSDPAVRAVNITAPAAVRIGTIYLGHITLNLTHCGQRVTLPASGQGYATGGLGSGAFISANGDILTADHVVNIPREALDQEIFQSETSAREIAKVINACYANLSFPITPEDVANGIVSVLGISFSTQYSAPQVLVWRDTAWSGELTGKAGAG
ncbi:MAG TPA: S1C family serine protease, partial [Ktedonobacterales bacterium]